MILELALRGAGLSLVVLALFHVVLWRTLDWSSEMTKLSPLNARVFGVHTFFVAFVLGGLGLLSLLRPRLLLERSELARLLLFGIVVFWMARLVLQATVFDRVMRTGWTRSPLLRAGVTVLWLVYVAIYGAALLAQTDGASVGLAFASFDARSPRTWLRVAVASVWLVFGLLFKALDAVPRHRRIVARVVGPSRAGAVLWLVALAEIGLGAWMLVGRALPACMAAQTLLLVSMNALELRYARDLLLSPLGMVTANGVFLSLGWYVALAGA